MSRVDQKTGELFEDCPSVRLSFREALRRAALQVGLYECSADAERDALRELCYLIAEVYIMDPDATVKIGGEVLAVYLVQEIFAELTLDHLRMVRENFKTQTGVIRNKRAYLRTALYNAVFEISANYENLVSHNMKGEDL